jgi:hypothetical protein
VKWSRGMFALLATFVCLGTNPQQLLAADWHWVDATPDHVPFDAIIGGRDATEDLLYICRASHQNGMYPGKFRPGFRGCNIGSDRNEIAVPNFQVLVPPWEASSNGNVPHEAPTFGHEDPNAGSHPLFVCRASHQGSLHPGWVNFGSGGCHIGYGGKEFTVTSYNVLVTWPFAVQEDLPDTEALIAGTENGMNLWICIADFAGGKYPGKIRSGFDGCHIGLGGVEVDVNQTKGTWRLLIPTWEPFAPADPSQNPSLFKAGNDSNGTPLYVCRSGLPIEAKGSGEHPGRYRIGAGACDVTWAGKEYLESQNFRILGQMAIFQLPLPKVHLPK